MVLFAANFILVSETKKNVELSNQIERVTLKPLDRLRSAVGGLILMIGGSGENGQGVEVVTGKGKEVVRVNVFY